MKRLLPILIASFLTVLFSLSIALWIPKSHYSSSLALAKNMMNRTDPIHLTDRNMVDFFVSIPLNLRISHVDLQDSVLSVDLMVDVNQSSKTKVYRDLYETVHSIFTRTSNINVVFIRVLNHRNMMNAKSELYLAMDASRDQVKTQFQQINEQDALSIKHFLLTHFHFVFTSLWNEWYSV